MAPENKISFHFKKDFTVDSRHIRAMGTSRKGRARTANQDRFTAKMIPDGALIAAVADGMGGVKAGDVAAQMAVAGFETLKRIIRGKESASLATLFKGIDHHILKTADRNPEFRTMGTTLTGLYIKGEYAHWAHVGDSRIFLFRQGTLSQMTRDHTLARFLYEKGDITEEQMADHHSQHILKQSIGRGRCVPDTGAFALKKDDLLLLSTDGLHKPVDTPEIEQILNSGAQAHRDSINEILAQTALDAGGGDDITILLLHVL